MKVKELKLMNKFDLENKIIELKKELMKINTQVATRTIPKNPTKIRNIRRNIAKILTINQDKEFTKHKEVIKKNG